eukprot:scaffold2636_cov340-Pavlova_lutheri.AAC.122
MAPFTHSGASGRQKSFCMSTTSSAVRSAAGAIWDASTALPRPDRTRGSPSNIRSAPFAASDRSQSARRRFARVVQRLEPSGWFRRPHTSDPPRTRPRINPS